MNTTHLSLYFYDNPDPKLFFIQDVSTYNPDIEITHRYLTITPPNFSQSYTIEYPQHSLLPINSNVFEWTNTLHYSHLTDLPDGLYKIQQSVNPNCLVKRDYIYFRITSLKTNILSRISESFSINANCFDCSRDESWYKDLFQYLQWLEAAKYMAECENKQEEAKLLYNSVLGKLCQSEC